MTHQDDANSGVGPGEEPEPQRPSRPAAIELSAAILIVGGALGLAGALASATGLPAGDEGFLALTIALAVGSIVIGVLIRYGRLWILDVNYVAVLGFLDLLGAGSSPISLMLGVAELLVVVILFVNKPWFDAMAGWRLARAEAPRRLSP